MLFGLIFVCGCTLINQTTPDEVIREQSQIDGNYEYVDPEIKTDSKKVIEKAVENQSVTGHYENGEAYIDVEMLEDNLIKFQGEAFWYNAFNDVIHTGEIGGVVDFDDGTAVYLAGVQEYDCQVEMIFENNQIQVSDNKMCGGLNVTFDGTYEKIKDTADDWSLFDMLSNEQ